MDASEGKVKEGIVSGGTVSTAASVSFEVIVPCHAGAGVCGYCRVVSACLSVVREQCIILQSWQTSDDGRVDLFSIVRSSMMK
jgi:hypothetical protein